MEKFHRTNYIKNNKKNGGDLDIHIIEWWAQDEYDELESESDESSSCKYCQKDEEYCKCDTSKYIIRCFGVNEVGQSVTCKITGYLPEFYIKVSNDFNNTKLNYFLEWINNSYYNKLYPRALIKKECKIVKKKDIYGFKNNKEYTFIKLVFNNYTALKRMRYLFKKPIAINKLTKNPVKYKLYESNFDGFMRFCHKKDIYMAGWIRLPNGKYSITNSEANTQLEVSIDYDSVVSLKEKAEMGNFLQASFDIETYSHDRAFPDPNKVFKIDGKNRKPNEIFQIATTFKYYNEKEMLIKHLFTLKRCSPIEEPDVIVEECKDEKDLIRRWVNLIHSMDPDILYTYNGDSFDCKYIVERSKIYNIEDYVFSRLSRLENTPGYMKDKPETFSSSAYGDSEYYRIYIPGRLNYDLLIHYQRGIKKYPSYRLDYIANEILKEGKHDIDAKTMFNYYEEGNPEKIKEIGNYCFVEGTRVSLPSCSIDIKCLENMETDVITWVENKGFSTSKKVHFFNNGEKECIELTLIDGTKINCTKDHRFLTKSGWIEGQNLQSTDKILYYPEQAFVDYEKEKLYTFKFSELIGELSYEKSSILCRILGYLLTDGGISESTCYKNYSSGKVKYIYDVSYIHLGTKIDSINMQKDIFTLIGKSPAIQKDKYTYRITLPTELTKMILSLDGIEKGKRLDKPTTLPKFILNESCPLWIIREFIKGLMGGDGHCPCFTKSGNKFLNVMFSQSKTYEQLSSLNNYMIKLQNLFNKLNIRTIISNVIKNDKGDGYTQKLTIKQDDIIKYYETIGYAYCVGKTYKLAIVSSYYKLKKETKKQFNWVRERVKKLKQNMKIKDALEQAHNELIQNEPIFNNHYSLPNIKIMYLDKESTYNSKFRKEFFPSAKEYLILTGSYEKFVTNDNKKSHAVKQDATHSPCYYLSILNKKDIGTKAVYDIEVKDTHNFIANGAVVHNCIQDTALLQKLVDKQLVLINIMQLANVTYVPIKFLTTRGQTIKVFSQLLRKARQMNYLVPDTNFNEDSYPISIKFYDDHTIESCDIGEYVEIKNMASDTQGGRDKNISCKISEIVDSKTIIVVSDTELKKEYYNKTISYKYANYKSSRLFPNDEEINDSFSGAYVLDADKNLHSDNICILDFASLYPTIMIAWNLCYSTFVKDPKYLDIDGVNYERLQWDDKIEYKMKHTCVNVMKTGKRKGEVCGKQAYFEIDEKYLCRIHDLNKKERSADEKISKRDVSYDFTIVQPHTDSNGNVVNKGVLPALLEELYQERKSVKKRMAIAKEQGNKLLENILNSTQLSIKISLNSCYGFLGRKQGNLVLKELGSIVTSNGRKLLDQSKNYAEREFLEYVKDNKLNYQKLTEIELDESDSVLDKYKC
jgi:DNA polymerase elongation subunit (family B)/intein/homing endonuclease